MYLVEALATKVPSIVAKIVDDIAINNELNKALCKVFS